MVGNLTNENIYNLIPRQQQIPDASSRYQSKFNATFSGGSGGGSAEFGKRQPHQTMGEAKVPLPKPDDFLKKHSKESRTSELRRSPDLIRGEYDDMYQQLQQKKPPVPKVTEKPVMGLKTNKNFITQNAVENIMAVPKKPEKILVDTRYGAKQQLDDSGLRLKYVNKKDFGKTPEYLIKRQQEMEEEQRQYNLYITDMQKRGAMEQLSEAERQAILIGLKHNWEELHHQYQSLSVVIDTVPKKHKKEWLESEMKQLEKDIEIMEKHTCIYIAN